MRPYVRYLAYVARHRWHVFLHCYRAGIPLRGLLHDLSKLRPDELVPYARHFYGRETATTRPKDGYYKPEDTGDAAFDHAWFLHQKRNPHHWQYWTLPTESGDLKVLPMPPAERLEMLCDWLGAAAAQRSEQGVKAWYVKHRHQMHLHPETRRWVETELNLVNPSNRHGIASFDEAKLRLIDWLRQQPCPAWWIDFAAALDLSTVAIEHAIGELLAEGAIAAAPSGGYHAVPRSPAAG